MLLTLLLVRLDTERPWTPVVGQLWTAFLRREADGHGGQNIRVRTSV